MKVSRIKIKVFGYVQGVFFRYTTRKVARTLGLKGFVKNLPDGSVYIEAEGLMIN
jgi:acylphosphatase